ncbi:hypothetical protein M427DRAFT_243612 [Gonapodya prolifera JEL478]|uniref:Histone H1 n=1 Tax=Gonapodya prolifera (strain JEL478) TaxID=1344416 RepID=A0A139ALL6_GONPJ|nr:hypothetical protein M427DRAFT_243612 [Gonapodya prolifera JEL478]|eukprot:KXS17671.1 hypothetical protein M427DRAFT_243612 [Gonapodya prolifera JEL478]
MFISFWQEPRRGSARQDIVKYIRSNYANLQDLEAHTIIAIRKHLDTGMLEYTNGSSGPLGIKRSAGPPRNLKAAKETPNCLGSVTYSQPDVQPVGRQLSKKVAVAVGTPSGSTTSLTSHTNTERARTSSANTQTIDKAKIGKSNTKNQRIQSSSTRGGPLGTGRNDTNRGGQIRSAATTKGLQGTNRQPHGATRDLASSPENFKIAKAGSVIPLSVLFHFFAWSLRCSLAYSPVAISETVQALRASFHPLVLSEILPIILGTEPGPNGTMEVPLCCLFLLALMLTFQSNRSMGLVWHNQLDQVP